MRHATLIDVFRSVEERRRPDVLRWKEAGVWRELSSGGFAERARRLAAFLIDFGLEPGDRVAILSENRPDWTIADFAILLSGGVTVPIYPSSSLEQVTALVDHSGAGIVVVGGGALVSLAAGAARRAKGAVRLLTLDRDRSLAGGPEGGIGRVESAALEEACEHGRRCLEGAPRRVDERAARVGPGDLASLVYTSGTTGEPKGVMLTHANFAANIDACLERVPLSPADAALSLLPLSHVLERAVTYMYLTAGGSVAYVQSVETAAADIRETRPTVITIVPRVLEKMRARILEAARESSLLKRRLFELGCRSARKRIALERAGRPVPLFDRWAGALADRLVFEKVRNGLGGRIRFLISGGAPLSEELADFFLAVGVLVLEGYGLTETSPVVAVNAPTERRPGSVGRPLPNLEVKIAADGEILVKGPSVMKGYYRDEAATREVLRKGWLATGDIGTLDADGFLRITDRKKDILITSGGKNIAPQPIEDAIRESPYVANVVLVGDRRRFVSALVVPDLRALGRYAEETGLPGGEPRGLVHLPAIRALLEAEIEKTTRTFAAHEKIRRFAILENDFSIDDGELTPTLKVKRRVIAERYSQLIESLYAH